ncbi:Putative cytosolic protein [Staphylococcus muscae]|nr:hypothetical protein CD131_06555 [Staphylococcus muscae]SNW03142.1 Putative cytosolic protein [Staphylococcus muscae]
MGLERPMKQSSIKGEYNRMKEPQTINQVKERLSQFIEEMSHVNPDEVEVADIDEWIALLDQLEEKVNQLRH